jgi:hypothetical protein
LEIDAEHVIFGHTHRAGPLGDDDPSEWRAPGGTALHNSGCWVHESTFSGAAGAASPYWPGGAIRVDDDGAPRPLRLLEDFSPSEPGPA